MPFDWLHLRPSQSDVKIRVRAMMANAFVDEYADVVQTQVIAQKARISLRNRAGVPLYHQIGEDRGPTWAENLIVETGLAEAPGMDSRYVLQDSRNLWSGIRYNVTPLHGGFNLTNKHLGIAAMVFGAVCFLAFAWLVGVLEPDGPAPEPVPQERMVEQTPTAIPNDSGVVVRPTPEGDAP